MRNIDTLKFSVLKQALNFEDGSFVYFSVIQTVLRSLEMDREKMENLMNIFNYVNHGNELSVSMKL
jgi:hypothetical protein